MNESDLNIASCTNTGNNHIITYSFIKKGVKMLYIVYTISVCLIKWVDYQNNHTYTSILDFDFY